MSHAEYNKCERNVISVCQLAKAIQRNSTPGCLSGLQHGDVHIAEKHCVVNMHSTLSPIFYRPDSSLQYIFSVPKRIAVSLRCEERMQKPSFPAFLEGGGYLFLPPTCVANTETFALLGNGILSAGNINLAETVLLPQIEFFRSINFLGRLNLSSDVAKYQRILNLFSQSLAADRPDGSIPLSAVLAEAQAVEDINWSDNGPSYLMAVVLFSVTTTALMVFLVRFSRAYCRRSNSRSWCPRPPTTLEESATTVTSSAPAKITGIPCPLPDTAFNAPPMTF